QKPYTWFRLGGVVLEGGCHALALAFAGKAVALLPPGLQQQEKGRFSDAHSAAEEARDLDPFGKAVRLLCPRLMALHSEDALRQHFTRESLSAVRVQRAWRGHRVVRVLRDLVSKQVAALRIQRFMREWRRCNSGLALRFFAASALELRQGFVVCVNCRLTAPCAKAMGLSAKAAAAGRLAALVTSAIAVQRGARALIARRRVLRRREAIAALQAFFRGCRARWALSAALESSTRLGISGDGSRQRQDVAGGNDGLDRGHNAGESSGTLWGSSGPSEELLLGCGTSIQVGVVTRRDAPMDTGCPKGFGSPNLAAFLWETRTDAYGHDSDGGGGGSGTALEAQRSEKEAYDRLCSPLYESRVRGGSSGRDSDDDGTVFEASAAAVAISSSACRKGVQEGAPQKVVEPVLANSSADDGGRPPAFGKPCISRGLPSPQRPLRWVPATVAPEEALRCALKCSTLIVNSPSFGSACARRLFSRMGTALSDVSRAGINPAAAPTTTRATTRGRRRSQASTVDIEVEQARTGCPARGRRQADGIKHILLVGESPVGDGGLLELSSALRCGWLPRLTTLVIGGHGCRVGPRGVTTLAAALSSTGCSQLRNLSMSHCCLGRRRLRNCPLCKNHHHHYHHPHHHQQQHSSTGPLLDPEPTQKTSAAAHASWDAFFRHLQRLPLLSTLSLQDCGLQDRDVRSLSIALQILPSGRLRCLRLSRNCVGKSGLRMLLTALTSRRMRLPALWLRGQRPALAESGVRRIVEDAFRFDGLFAEVEFERPFEAMGGRSRLRLMERTTESEDLGSPVQKHPTSTIYV
ncbi:unnamed protein product, partial [Hapterophycus canaliculatus]